MDFTRLTRIDKSTSDWRHNEIQMCWTRRNQFQTIRCRSGGWFRCCCCVIFFSYRLGNIACDAPIFTGTETHRFQLRKTSFGCRHFFFIPFLASTQLYLLFQSEKWKCFFFFKSLSSVRSAYGFGRWHAHCCCHLCCRECVCVYVCAVFVMFRWDFHAIAVDNVRDTIDIPTKSELPFASGVVQCSSLCIYKIWIKIKLYTAT